MMMCIDCELNHSYCTANTSEDCERISKAVKGDLVNHPSHYLQGGRETIETIKDVTSEGFEGYLVGSIIKYISRYKYKNGVEDVKKCEWYIKKLIEVLEVDKDAKLNK